MKLWKVVESCGRKMKLWKVVEGKRVYISKKA
jgi:hypothetical protein